MYQAIYYNFTNYTYHLRDDETGWHEFQYKPTYYERVEEEQEGALPVLTGGWAMPTQKFNKDNPNLLEKDINKELVVLRDLYYEIDDKIPKWHNVLLFDIEIEIGGALTPEYIKASPMPITSIALLDKTTKQKICFIVDKSKELKSVDKTDIHLVICESERELIQKFLNKWEELDPTIIVGYNSSYFDIPYLYYRISRILGTPTANRLSPLGIVVEQAWDQTNPIRIAGVNHLDFMLLFKKYVPKQESSYKLGDIGFKYVDLGKVEYEGNLNQLYKTDINTFIDYNMRDVEIIDKLEDKLKFIELTILLSHICNIPYEQIYYNTAMNEGAILKFLKREGIVSPNKPTTHNPYLKEIKESYAGGYVKDPIPGLYFDVIDLDFTSLYPSIIKSLNLGIETLVGRIKPYENGNYEQEFSLEKLKQRPPDEIVTIEKVNTKTYKTKSTDVELGKIISLIEKNNYTISASGAIFRTDQQSVVAKILEGWFEKREHYRGLKKKAGKDEKWDDYKLYDLFQHAFKILQNAMYGTFALNSWRYTDGHKICSAAITNSGQRLTKDSFALVNNKINKELNTKKDYICISDTDSMYIELKDLIKHRHPDSTDEENIQHILNIANEIQNESNHYLNTLCRSLFNIDPKKHYFQLKQEVIAKSIIATGKRRYAMYVVNKEGINVEELDMKGLELMKSNMNKIFKKFGEGLIKDILFNKPKPQIDKSILDMYKSLKTMDMRNLGKPTGVKKLGEYVKSKPTSGKIFSTFELKAPSNTKSAVRYNDFLQFKQLDKKYESVIEGDKIFIINLKNNPYHIDTIAIPSGKVPKEIEDFVKQYIDIEGIFESILLNKLKNLYEDIGYTFPILNENVGKFFVFN
jgi:DNA polymerase elongation subunit (family B)